MNRQSIKDYREDLQIKLIEGKTLNQVLLDAMPEACFLFLETREVIVNHKIVKLFGYSSRNDIPKHLFEDFSFCENRDKIKIRKDIEKLANLERIRTHHYSFIRKDGQVFRGKVNIKRLRSRSSVKTFGYLGTIHDNSEQIFSSGIKKSFNDIMKDPADTVIITDFKGRILKANKKFFQINFFAERSIINYSLFGMVDKEYLPKLKEGLDRLKQGFRTDPMEYRLVDEAGRTVYVEMSSQPFGYRNKKAVLTRIRNITHIKELEKKLFNAILETEEKEKQRFAQDLHDELGPFLSGIKLFIDEVSLCDYSNEQRLEVIKYMRRMVDEALERMKIISNGLMSNILIDFGLVPAITSFVEKMNTIHKINVKLEIKIDGAILNKTSEIIIYRIIIELINNSLKHSKAHQIWISITWNDPYLRSVYKDDGVGFNVENELNFPKGIGLTSIINRLKSSNSTFHFSSELKKGMQLDFSMPLN